ncbi:MAG TPA: RNA 2'-phosphotransferase [Allosphingosinicella sp.]|nr:RNA 2'-phosphotransferase [Allosphingosinicella sp.]
MIKVSKFLARILRHDPGSAYLRLDRNGWADVDDVLVAISARFGGLTASDLAELVRSNDKSRYALSPDGSRIRANQGHSIDVDLGFEPMEPPALLYHGTKADLIPRIMREGLTKGRRHHVHLSADVATALKVGGRRGGEVAVLAIRSSDMTDFLFYRSSNGVWLIEHVPPTFIGTIDRAARSTSHA